MVIKCLIKIHQYQPRAILSNSMLAKISHNLWLQEGANERGRERVRARERCGGRSELVSIDENLSGLWSGWKQHHALTSYMQALNTKERSLTPITIALNSLRGWMWWEPQYCQDSSDLRTLTHAPQHAGQHAGIGPTLCVTSSHILASADMYIP